jgi:hypothetical protein
MKCLACGNTVLYKINRDGIARNQRNDSLHINALFGSMNGDMKVESFLCGKCGHIEDFIPEFEIIINKLKSELNALEAKEKELLECNSAIQTIQKDSAKFDKEILALRDFIKDENNSVKSIKEAETKIPIIEKQKRDFLNISNVWQLQQKVEKLKNELIALKNTLEKNPLTK